MQMLLCVFAERKFVAQTQQPFQKIFLSGESLLKWKAKFENSQKNYFAVAVIPLTRCVLISLAAGTYKTTKFHYHCIISRQDLHYIKSEMYPILDNIYIIRFNLGCFGACAEVYIISYLECNGRNETCNGKCICLHSMTRCKNG